MEIGLNLSFAVKRWLKPEHLAQMCAEEFGVNSVQFTLDLIDPWWPEYERNELANDYKNAFNKYGVKIASTFGGVASYTYAQLLAPSKKQRNISLEFFKRAVDLTRVLGADVMGTPIGGMSHEDAENAERASELYSCMLNSICELSEYGKDKGLREIQIEATPLKTEFLYTPAAAKKMMDDLNGITAIPVRLLIDWGHAFCNIISAEKADMSYWLNECAPYVGGIHLQQTDGLYDRHWDFTKEGLINAELIRNVTRTAGIEDIVQYLEVVTIFEEPDEIVLDGMKKSMQFLHTVFDEPE